MDKRKVRQVLVSISYTRILPSSFFRFRLTTNILASPIAEWNRISHSLERAAHRVHYKNAGPEICSEPAFAFNIAVSILLMPGHSILLPGFFRRKCR